MSEYALAELFLIVERQWEKTLFETFGVRFRVRCQRDGWLVIRARMDDFCVGTPDAEASEAGDQGGSPEKREYGGRAA